MTSPPHLAACHPRDLGPDPSLLRLGLPTCEGGRGSHSPARRTAAPVGKVRRPALTVVQSGDALAGGTFGSRAGEGVSKGARPRRGSVQSSSRAGPLPSASSPVLTFGVEWGRQRRAHVGSHPPHPPVRAGTWGGCEPTLDRQAREEKRLAPGSFLFGKPFCFLNVRVSRWCV